MFGRTPLHYAAQHGAAISSLSLISRGAQLDRVDNEGNTPLAIALRYKHPQYALFIIREKADVTRPVVYIERSTKPEEKGKIISRTEHSMFYPVVKNSWQGEDCHSLNVYYYFLKLLFNFTLQALRTCFLMQDSTTKSQWMMRWH